MPNRLCFTHPKVGFSADLLPNHHHNIIKYCFYFDTIGSCFTVCVRNRNDKKASCFDLYGKITCFYTSNLFEQQFCQINRNISMKRDSTELALVNSAPPNLQINKYYKVTYLSSKMADTAYIKLILLLLVFATPAKL